MKDTLTCIIIDDEPLAQELIEKFVKRINYLYVLKIFDNAIEALDEVEKLRPDIVFLDISMPEMTGLEFIRTFTKYKPHFIMTTAHPQFALDGFDHDVDDYLLKPIPFDRFVRAVNKVRDRIPRKTESDKIGVEKVYPINKDVDEEEIQEEIDDELLDEGLIKEHYLWVKEDRKLVKIDFNEIVYVEGMKDYIKIFLDKTMIITYMRMSKMESVLSTRKRFLRINRSFIINTKHMKALDGNMIELDNGKKLPIGTNYRDIIKNAMKSQLP